MWCEKEAINFHGRQLASGHLCLLMKNLAHVIRWRLLSARKERLPKLAKYLEIPPTRHWGFKAMKQRCKTGASEKMFSLHHFSVASFSDHQLESLFSIYNTANFCCFLLSQIPWVYNEGPVTRAAPTATSWWQHVGESRRWVSVGERNRGDAWRSWPVW